MQYDPRNHTNKNNREQNKRAGFFVFVRVISWIVCPCLRRANNWYDE